jgi:WD40 repeat protein
METLQTECTQEEHTHIITDVRFRPNSTQLATSSFDTSVRLWDAAEVSFLSLMLSHKNHPFFCMI